MSYIVTARKYRPVKFSDVVGQEHITQTLKNAIKNDRIAHAYIFAGPRGVGKTTTARILAKTLNCQHPVDFEPCNECEMCNSFNTSQSLDIIEIDGASNRRIEEIRTLRESVKYAPTKGNYKVYIIDEVHMLTNESFNALLKTLEEPPGHTIFIFATTDVHKVPLTIISRCQRFDFRRIELDHIKAQLRYIADNEKIEIDDQSLTMIAKKADGALRDAESIFDQIVSFCNGKVEYSILSHMLNLIDEELYFEISDAILQKKFAAAFEITARIYDNGWNFMDFVNGMTEHFRNMMTVELTSGSKLIEASESTKMRYETYSGKFSQSDLLRILNFTNKFQQELKVTSNQRLKTEVALCHLIGLEKSSSISQVIEKLEEIKKKTLESGSAQQLPLTPQTNGGAPANAIPVNGIPVNGISANNNGIAANNAARVQLQNSRTQRSPVPEPKPADVEFFKSVQGKWKEFVNSVKDEKFITAEALESLILMAADSSRLYVRCAQEHHEKILLQLKEYFVQKTEAHFGKSLSFEFRNDVASIPGFDIDESIQIKPASAGMAQAENTPLIDAIIKELDGEELY